MKFQGYFIVGVLLIAMGLLYEPMVSWLPGVMVVVDSTPPEVGETYPEMGKTYDKIMSLTVKCRDEESGIASVVATIDWGKLEVELEPMYYFGFMDWETWSKVLSHPITEPGAHYVKFVITNNAGLSTERHVYFNIQTDFTGKWYVAGVEIVTGNETIYVTDPRPQILVKFELTNNTYVDVDKVVCTVSWSGTTEGEKTLTPYQDVGLIYWQTVLDLPPGNYSLNLDATDGVNHVEFSALPVTIKGSVEPPEPPTIPTPPPTVMPPEFTGVPIGFFLVFFGSCIIVIGAFQMRKRKSSEES